MWYTKRLTDSAYEFKHRSTARKKYRIPEVDNAMTEYLESSTRGWKISSPSYITLRQKIIILGMKAQLIMF